MRTKNVHGDIERHFLDWVSGVENRTAPPEFSFVARKCPKGFYKLVKGRLSLNRVAPLTCAEDFCVENIRAGRFFVDHHELENFCRELVSGVIRRDGVELRLVVEETEGVEEIKYTSLDAGPGFQFERTSVYQLIGHEHGLDLDAHMDWNLKGANPPYDSFAELAADYQLGPISHLSTIDIAEFLVAAISNNSAVNGNQASIIIGLISGLDTLEASIGYRVVTPERKVRRRGVIAGKDIAWTELDERSEGTVTIDVEPGDVVNCYASYKQRAQTQNWAVDPANTQNPLRSAYEAFDPGLEKLTTWLRGGGSKKQNDFELGVSILAWLLGFPQMHFEREIITESPDVLLWGTNSVLVLECTVAAFGTDKIARLIGRGERIRQRLVASGHPNMLVRCLMVSCIDGDDAEAPRRIAQEQGIGFVDGNLIATLLNRTVFFPRTDELLKELLSQPVS